MPKQYINTPFKKYPSRTSKQVRIRIPQPVDTPVFIRSILHKDEMSATPDWINLHRKGVYRAYIGTDALEDRAVPKYTLRGTLPERIVYRYLVEYLHMADGDPFGFSFQSSLDGGRSDLGGLVVDFIFESRGFVLQVQGSTHFSFLRGRKDEEQTNILASMGYDVEELWEEEIYDLYKFENRMREIFSLYSHGGGSYGYIAEQMNPNEETLSDQNYQELYNLVLSIKSRLGKIYPK
jgi:hypothetical protein